MRSRGLVVAIAFVLAILAAAGVIVYTSNLQKNVRDENTTEVVVSTQDIAANTQLDPLIAQGVFKQIRMPNDALVAGAVTSPDEMKGQTTAAPIFANEPIPSARLSSGQGINNLGISPGHVGLGLQIEGAAAVNGMISQGSNIVIYATFPQGTALTKDSLAKLLTPAQMQRFFNAFGSTATATSVAGQPVVFMPTDFTVTLLKSVKVLTVQNPLTDQTTGRRASGATILALDMLPEDASELVFASTTQATLYLGLLPPDNKDGYSNPASFGVPLVRVTGVGAP